MLSPSPTIRLTSKSHARQKSDSRFRIMRANKLKFQHCKSIDFVLPSNWRSSGRSRGRWWNGSAKAGRRRHLGHAAVAMSWLRLAPATNLRRRLRSDRLRRRFSGDATSTATGRRSFGDASAATLPAAATPWRHLATHPGPRGRFHGDRRFQGDTSAVTRPLQRLRVRCNASATMPLSQN